MADVFISYSRTDEPFVERLRTALADAGVDVWVDREDIGPAVEWRREIELGILGADVFAFVISPDSLCSAPCRRELEHAVATHKRIAPLLLREPESLPVPEDLANRNYIFFRADSDFPSGLAALLAAIEDLPEWARQHTRLLERAEEWQDRGRDASFLLRGSDLADGERWLGEQGADREPRPTPLQTEYLLVSRAAATRRQRITIGAVAAALAVSVVLAVVALVQRNEATQQRDEAIRQAQLARSRELAAAAIAAVEADPWKALEMGVDAAETSPTPESTDALRAALEAPRESALLQVPDEFIGTARFTGDSAGVVTASYDRNGRRRILRWDLASGEPTPYRGPQPGGAPLGDLSPDGTLRVSARGLDPRLTDARVGTPLVEISRLGSGVEGARSAQFSPDGHAFLTLSPDGIVRVWPLEVTSLSARPTVAAAQSPDGRTCLTATGAIIVRFTSCRDAADAQSWSIPQPGFNTSFGHMAALGFADGDPRLSVYTDSTTTAVDVRSGDVLADLPVNGLFRPQVSPTGSIAVRRSSRDSAEVIDSATQKRIALLDVYLNNNAQAVAFSGDERKVAIFDYAAPVVRVWDLDDPRNPASIGRFEVEGVELDLNADGSLLLVGSETSTELWDVDREVRLRTFAGDRAVSAVAFSADERFVLTGANGGRVQVWETATGRPVVDYPVDIGAVAEASLSPDGLLLARGYQGSALVFDCRACQDPPELVATARAELERRPTPAATPVGP